MLVGRTPRAASARAGATGSAAHGEEDATRRRSRRLLAIEALGGEVLTVAADVADPAAMARRACAAAARFGAIHGVIHAAGGRAAASLQVKTREAAEAVLAPKVRGALVLDELFARRAARLPRPLLLDHRRPRQLGQVDYVAANAFLDAFAAGAGAPRRRRPVDQLGRLAGGRHGGRHRGAGGAAGMAAAGA